MSAAEAERLEEDYLLFHHHEIELARRDFQFFFEYVMRDEHTGERLRMQPFQREWWRIIEENDRALILAFMESGKSLVLSVALTLWELGLDPTLQFAIISRTTRQAKKICLLLARYIEESPELHEVFPSLRPDPRQPWNSEQLTVRRPSVSKDPSIQVVSIGKTVHGARLDRAILDDVLDRENTRIPSRRDDTWDWYKKSIPGRMTKTGRIRAVGNAFHKRDLYHRLARNKRWRAYRFPVIRPNGQPAWPEQWPLDRCMERREELIEEGGDAEWKCQMMCEPVDLSVAGLLFGRQEVRIIDSLAFLGEKEPAYVRRWDLAATEPHPQNLDPDWTCGVKMGRLKSGKYIIPSVIFARKRSDSIRKLVLDTARADGKWCQVGIAQDPGQAGVDQVNSYKTLLDGFRVWAEKESGDKVLRAEPFSAQWQAGNVILLRAPWNEQYLACMEAFPMEGFHDDAVDASSGAYRRCLAKRDIFKPFSQKG